jgi:hypothetical protein
MSIWSSLKDAFGVGNGATDVPPLNDYLAQENLRLSGCYSSGTALQASQGWAAASKGPYVQGHSYGTWTAHNSGIVWDWGEPRDQVIHRRDETREGTMRWYAVEGEWVGISTANERRKVHILDINGLEDVSTSQMFDRSEYPTEIAELYEAIIAQQLEKPDGPTNT